MNNKFFGKLCLCLALVFGAFVFQANAQGNVDLSGSISNGKLQRGKTITATIVMDIPGGLHVNTNRPGNQYSIPLKIRVTGAGLKLGAISYPRGTTKKFSFSDDTLNVYEGRTTFRFPVTVPANFKGNTTKIRVVASYQSCTDEVCYRPKTAEVTLSAAVK